MIYRAISELRHKFSVSLLCSVGKVSKSGYYRWLNRKPQSFEEPLRFIQYEQRKSHQTIGYRKMRNILKNSHRINLSYEITRKLMLVSGLQSLCRHKKPKCIRSQGLEALVAANVLNRNFTTSKSGKKYVTDITYIPLRNSMVYLSTIMDLFNNEIVAYKLSLRQDKSLSIDTFRELAAKRNLSGAIVHSDQGVHYTNKAFQEFLKQNGIVQSMSRRGNCWDNAMAENFFSQYKCECIRTQKQALLTYEDVAVATKEYIEYYNNYRIQKKLGYVSPKDYRDKF